MAHQHLLNRLTEREREIARLIADGLSNHDIAQKLVLTPGTVRWYCGQIYSKIGVNTRAQAVKSLQGLHDPAASGTPASKIRLPTPLTPLIGREREIATIHDLLQTNRLLTLTGTGGTGKTRLALAVAAEAANEFADGVSFVDLSPITDASVVAKTIAHFLGVMENTNEALPDTLKRALAGQEHLLVVDNFEHVITGAPIVPQLLASAPHLKILVTSREALRVSGEQEYAVPPLTLPTIESSSAQDGRQSEAVALFQQRAAMIRPEFELTDENLAAVAEICVRLDGLPLAIELAAARCKLLSPQTLLSRLDSSLNVLTGGLRDAPARQQTLRSAIEWSYNLLDEGEQMVFARLAVFRDRRSLEAVEAICGDGLPMDVLNGLASLVDKNLVQQEEDTGGESHFVMLETIHEFAWERLNERGEVEALQRRHAEYFVALAERAEPELRLVQQQRWFQTLEREHQNLRSALEWSLSSGEIAGGLRIAGALHLFWAASGYHTEGFEWTQRLLNRLDEAPVAYQPKFLISAAGMASYFDLHIGTQLYTKAIDIAASIGDQLQFAWALSLGASSMLENVEQAMTFAQKGLTLFRELDNEAGIAQATAMIAEIARFQGDDRRAKRGYEESLTIFQKIGDRRLSYIVFVNLSVIFRLEGDHQRAIDLIQEGLRLAGGVSNRFDLACDLANMAAPIAGLGQPQRAARLLGYSEAALESMGAFHQPIDRPQIERDIAAVRALLDEATFRAAWAEGRKLTLEQAMAEALRE